MSFGNLVINTNLIISNIIFSSQVIVQAVDQITGNVFGTFTLSNLLNGGVEIIAVSPGDGNYYTNEIFQILL